MSAGFVIQTAEVPKGDCVKKNCLRIAEFWDRGWYDCELNVLIIQRPTDCKFIKHVNIHNKKTNQIIDVSNGMIKMIDFQKWRSANKIVKMIKIDRPNFELFKDTIYAKDKFGNPMTLEEVGEARILGEMCIKCIDTLSYSKKKNRKRAHQNGGGRGRCKNNAIAGCFQVGC